MATKVSFLLLLLLALVASVTGVAYQVQIQFDAESIKEIFAANQGVMLARRGPAGSWYSLWASFRPFPNNYLGWDDDGYNVYLAVGQLTNGRVLSPGSWTAASLGLLYPFHLGIFDSPRSASWVAGDQIGIQNNGSDVFIVGLTANITINSR